MGGVEGGGMTSWRCLVWGVGGGEGGAQDVAKVGGVDPGHHDGEGGATRRCVVKLRGINRSV